jgi:hypothetical protein
MISQNLREQLVNAVCNIPAAETENGRGALLAGLPIPFGANFRDSNKHTDVSNIVWLLAECYGPRKEWWLLRFIDNAINSVAGTEIAQDLRKLKQSLVANSKTAFVNWAEIAQVHFFDMSQLALMCLANLPKKGGLSGFVIHGASSAILDNLCQSLPYRGEMWVRIWTRNQVFPNAPLCVGPLETAVSVVADSLRKLERLIATKHVAWPVELKSEQDAEKVWKAAKVIPAQRLEKHLILVFGMPLGQKAPPEMKTLDCPVFEAQDVRIWVEEIAKIRSWDPALIDRWTNVLVRGPQDGAFPSHEMLYRNLERFHRLLVLHSEDDDGLKQDLLDYEQLEGM